MHTRILTVIALAFGATIIGASGALAQRGPATTIDIPPIEPCFIRCVPPPPVGEIPDPEPDPVLPAPGIESPFYALGCEVRDDGLVFRNLGELTVATRTRLQWTTSDGQSGKLTLGQTFEPKTSLLYAGAQVDTKAVCSLTTI